ncbi:MAG: hypothetical protein AAGL49_04705 [Pseudomonadota bacterium]
MSADWDGAFTVNYVGLETAAPAFRAGAPEAVKAYIKYAAEPPSLLKRMGDRMVQRTLDHGLIAHFADLIEEVCVAGTEICFAYSGAAYDHAGATPGA